VKWQYWFTTAEEKRRSGAWWRRQELGLYAPTLKLGPEGIQAVAMPPSEMIPRTWCCLGTSARDSQADHGRRNNQSRCADAAACSTGGQLTLQ